MRQPMPFLFALLIPLCGAAADMDPGPRRLLEWRPVPPLPDGEGFAGSYAGVSGGALVVAGGANFPGKRPWEGGAKAWHDSAFVLEQPDGAWRTGFRLPRPLAYGVAVTHPRGVVCAGGSDAQGHTADVFVLSWEGGALRIAPLPSLPAPRANLCGAVLGPHLYVAGGIDRPDATRALGSFWRLDLDDPGTGWEELESWPGPGRMLATAGAQAGSFFVLGGAALAAGPDGRPVREWLRDAWRYTPGRGWKRIADLPRAAVAAPSPAPPLGQSHLLVLGGDDGAQAGAPPETHRGFPRDVLAYHAITDTWARLDELPFSLVTSPAVEWKGRIVVPGGETRPGVRSPLVWAAVPVQRKGAFGWLNYATLGIYLAVMLAIGWVCTRFNRDTDDYFRAGGRIPWWAAGLSIYATMLSSMTFMAIPAKTYASDWTWAWANVPILLLAPVVIAFYLPFFRRLDVTSAYEYLETRFNLAARLYGSTAFVLLHLGRQAIVLLLPALALAAVCDFDVRLGILLMGVLCVVYTSMGGIGAVIWTDVVQSVVLLGGAILSLVLILAGCGGVSGFWSTAAASGKFHLFNWTMDPSTEANAFWAILVGSLFINLVPYTSDQAVVQRYMTTKDQGKAARAIWTNALLSIPSTILFFGIGTALFVFYKIHPERLDPTLSTDAIFPAFIIQSLPAGVAGLVIAGIFAAAQSTVSSSLNSSVAVLMTDFYRRLGGRAEGARGLRLARGLTAAIGVLATLAALVLAEADARSLWDVYNGLVGLTASGLAGLFALGIFTRRANGAGALVGAVASAVVLYLVQQHTRLHFFLYAGVGTTTCFVVGWLASLACPPSRGGGPGFPHVVSLERRPEP